MIYDFIVTTAITAAVLCALFPSAARLAASVLLSHADAIDSFRRQWGMSWRHWTDAYVPGLIRHAQHERE